MHKYYSIIIGENPKYTASYQQGSRRKIALYANCLLIPVILWFINGYLIVTQVLSGSIVNALVIATIAALIIFLIERSIIMSNGSRAILWFRVLVGFIVASLGSISFDEVIFKHDIDNQMAIYKQAEIDNAVKKIDDEYNRVIALQQAIRDNKALEWNTWQAKAADNAGGKNGAPYGFKKVAQMLLGLANQKKVDYENADAKLNDLRNAFVAEKKTAMNNVEQNFTSDALLLRIKALFDLVAKDMIMMTVYILFTSLLFFLEFIVILVKISSKNSIDEDFEIAREELLRARAKKMVERSSSFYNPEQLSPIVQSANKLIRQNTSSIFD